MIADQIVHLGGRAVQQFDRRLREHAADDLRGCIFDQEAVLVIGLRLELHLREIILQFRHETHQAEGALHEKGLHGRGRHHHPADVDGEFDQRPGVRLALGLIGVEHAGADIALGDGGEAPGERMGVAHAAVHALAGEGRCQMRGIASEIDALAVPRVADARVEGIDLPAHDLGVGIGTVGREQFLDRFWRGDLFVGFAFAQFEFITALAVGAGQADGGAGRIAEHAGLAQTLFRLFHVDDEPFVGIGRSLQFGADDLAQCAAAAVAGGEIFGADRQWRAVEALDDDSDTVGIFHNAFERMLEQRLDARPARQALAQGGFEFRLGEGAAARIAIFAGRRFDAGEIDA